MSADEIMTALADTAQVLTRRTDGRDYLDVLMHTSQVETVKAVLRDTAHRIKAQPEGARFGWIVVTL